MSAKSFKFVSPGVFIQEIDNSALTKKVDAIGPVIIGRSRRGLAMTPTKVDSYSDFVEMFGDTVPGNSGGDVYRDGSDMQSPMYGTYAARAFMRSNVAPLTYMRLLGQQHNTVLTSDAAAAQAGWRTDQFMNDGGGGAFGLWVGPSASTDVAGSTVSMQLAAVWYNDNGGIALSGTLYGDGGLGQTGSVAGAGALVESDTGGRFTVLISGSTTAVKKVTFGLDDTSESFIRKQFTTNPQLRVGGDFYSSAMESDYWLGETFEQEVLDAGLNSGALVGCIVGVQLDATNNYTPANMLFQSSSEAQAGWFVGQDLGTAGSFEPDSSTRLFRLIGRGHGEWLNRNCKVSIEKIRASTTIGSATGTDYGTFSIVIRALNDTDNNPQVMERFDNLDLNPESANFVVRRIGNRKINWNTTDTPNHLEEVGEYPNQSKFVYVAATNAVLAGGTKTLLPFGYWGPPKFTDVTTNAGTGSTATTWNNYYVWSATGIPNWIPTGTAITCSIPLSASLAFPSVRLRLSASDGGLTDPTNASFGMQTTRLSSSTVGIKGIADCHRLWTPQVPYDPASVTRTGIDPHSYIFTMDDVVNASVATSGSSFFYRSGSRKDGDSYTATGSNTYKDLLTAGYDSFTAPFWGGFDGFNIRLPDPMWNGGMVVGSTSKNNSIYWTWRRAIDTVVDPEAVDMNLLMAPGLTNDNLTSHMINVAENRGDTLAVVDLPNVYLPRSEGQYTTRPSAADRTPISPQTAATALEARGLDSSYGATFYPWVQTRDANTGQLVWIPPTVAMAGVLASSEKKAAVWFAPAGFNRGGLSEGAAGIPVLSVTQRLTSKQRDTLYGSNINPIASFPSTGIVVFGQKTLQTSKQSALDRINVRRLVIYLKKQISVLSTKVLFEQNVSTTWAKFRALIEPLLANVKTQYGITDYKLILDETTTTDDLIDRNIMYAKIMIKPARAIEYIAIDFVIASTGASFDD